MTYESAMGTITNGTETETSVVSDTCPTQNCPSGHVKTSHYESRIGEGAVERTRQARENLLRRGCSFLCAPKNQLITGSAVSYYCCPPATQQSVVAPELTEAPVLDQSNNGSFSRLPDTSYQLQDAVLTAMQEAREGNEDAMAALRLIVSQPLFSSERGAARPESVTEQVWNEYQQALDEAYELTSEGLPSWVMPVAIGGGALAFVGLIAFLIARR